MKLTMIAPARREMLRAARWYDHKVPGLGDRFLDEIRNALVGIVEFPAAFAPLDADYRRKLIEVFPYGLIYRVDGDEIMVVAVANLKRRPAYWRKQLAEKRG